MAYFPKRRRKPLAAVALACWAFALAVSVAHACGLDAGLSQPHGVTPMTMSGQGDPLHSTPAGCEQFCADDFPLLAKLKLVQDQSGAQPLLISMPSVEPLLVSGPTVASPSRSPGPAPVVAVNIRFLRLAL